MKNRFINFLKCPITWVVFSLGFIIFCIILMAFIVYYYPFAYEDDMFIVGVRFGVLWFGLFEGVYYTCSNFVSLGKWINIRKVSNNGSIDSKE